MNIIISFISMTNKHTKVFVITKSRRKPTKTHNTNRYQKHAISQLEMRECRSPAKPHSAKMHQIVPHKNFLVLGRVSI